MTDLYELLGVSPTATPQEIKAAYRKASAANHPDRDGGDAETMQQVNDAYAVLSDPEKRARYDSTGDAGQVHKPSPELQAETALVHLYERILEAHSYSVSVDYNRHARNAIGENSVNAHNAITVAQQKQERIRKVTRRASGRLLVGRLEQKCEDLNREIEAHKSTIEQLNLALKFLDEYGIEQAQAHDGIHQQLFEQGIVRS